MTPNLLFRKIALGGLAGIRAVLHPFYPLVRDPAVLLYHSVSHDPWQYAVSPRAFERQIRYLREECNPVSLADVVSYAEGKKELPPRSVAVTFDDGYRDFRDIAFPILARYRVPATLFVCTGEVDRRELGTEKPLLTWEDLKDLHASGFIAMGSHAATHRKLTRLNSRTLSEDLRSSRDRIRDVLGVSPEFLAYPKGAHNPDVRRSAREAGFRAACAVYPRLVSASRRGDLFSIPRIQMDASVSWFEFKTRLTEVSNWYIALREILHI